MLLKASDYMREAEGNAANCAERASTTDDPKMKADWLALEAKWRRLSQFYDFVKTAQRFMEDAQTAQGPPGEAELDKGVLPDQPSSARVS